VEVNYLAYGLRFTSFGVHNSSENESIRKVVGWGPLDVEPGDAVVAIHEYNLPIILHKSQDNKYRFMGSFYVHGYVNGEALDVEGLADEELIAAYALYL
jgi:hypothetical protein